MDWNRLLNAPQSSQAPPHLTRTTQPGSSSGYLQKTSLPPNHWPQSRNQFNFPGNSNLFLSSQSEPQPAVRHNLQQEHHVHSQQAPNHSARFPHHSQHGLGLTGPGFPCRSGYPPLQSVSRPAHSSSLSQPSPHLTAQSQLATPPFHSSASQNVQQPASNVPYSVAGRTSSNLQNIPPLSRNPGPPQHSLLYSQPPTVCHPQLHGNPLPRAPANPNIAPAQNVVNCTRGYASGVSRAPLPAPQHLPQCTPSSTVPIPSHSSSMAPAPPAPTPALQPSTSRPKPKPKNVKAKASQPPAPVAPTVAISSGSRISMAVSSLLNNSSSTPLRQFSSPPTPLPTSPRSNSHPPSPQNSPPPPRSRSSSPEQGVTSLRKKEQPVQSDSEEDDGIPTVRGKIGAAEKEIAGPSTSEKLRDAVKVLLDNLDEGIRKAASEEKVSVLRVKQLIGIHMSFRNRRGNSIFNAAVHRKAEEMNAGRRKGHRYKLTEIIELVHQDKDLKYAINHPRSTQAKELLEELEAYQMDQFKGTVANPKSTHNDVTKTFRRMTETAQNLSKRAHVLTFGIVCNSKRGQNVPRNFFGTGPIEGFLKMKFNMTCAEFVEAVESYCVLMADGRRKREVNAKNMREAIKSWMHDSLTELTKNPAMSMEYKDYDILIVYIHGIELVGWPEDVPFQEPHSLRSNQLGKIFTGIFDDKSLKWEKMPEVRLLKRRREIEEGVKNGSLRLPRDLVKGKKQKTMQPVDVLRARLPKKKGKGKKKGQQQVMSEDDDSDRDREGVNKVGDQVGDSDAHEESEAEVRDGEKPSKKRKKTNSSRKTTKRRKFDSNSVSGSDESDTETLRHPSSTKAASHLRPNRRMAHKRAPVEDEESEADDTASARHTPQHPITPSDEEIDQLDGTDEESVPPQQRPASRGGDDDDYLLSDVPDSMRNFIRYRRSLFDDDEDNERFDDLLDDSNVDL